ncbi:MAG: SMI1/KNR4 family protein [Thermogemmatispora sp.]|uniref:SMI1/KNR4 family protein n=1 Tax=Thermogemmatispora sp. TaxID=1968838 RepID=UPI001A08C27D|nr:SMI1/KNR4 family protein [Thermogemmatispora sp.]
MEPSKRIEEHRRGYDPRQVMRALRESLDERGRLRLLGGGYRWEAGFRFGEPAREEELEELEARLRLALPGVKVPLPWSYREWLKASNGAVLYRDEEYGQWGYRLFSTAELISKQVEWQATLYDEHWLPSGLVVGELIGGRDTIVLETGDVSEQSGEGIVLYGDCEEKPEEWRAIAHSFGQWLSWLVTAQGAGYWQWFAPQRRGGQSEGEEKGRKRARWKRWPVVVDPRTGERVEAPELGERRRLAAWEREPWGYAERRRYVRRWREQGREELPGGWKRYDLVQVVPREYGGSNEEENLVPVDREVHGWLMVPWWREWEWERGRERRGASRKEREERSERGREAAEWTREGLKRLKELKARVGPRGKVQVRDEEGQEWEAWMQFGEPAGEEEVRSLEVSLRQGGKELRGGLARGYRELLQVSNGMELYVDGEAGQWGYRLYRAEEVYGQTVSRELAYGSARWPERYLVIGETLGDGDLIVLEMGEGEEWGVIDGDSGYGPEEWKRIAGSVGEWLAGLIEHEGRKYWREEEQRRERGLASERGI